MEARVEDIVQKTERKGQKRIQEENKTRELICEVQYLCSRRSKANGSDKVIKEITHGHLPRPKELHFQSEMVLSEPRARGGKRRR